jgi:hypothetical protein
LLNLIYRIKAWKQKLSYLSLVIWLTYSGSGYFDYLLFILLMKDTCIYRIIRIAEYTAPAEMGRSLLVIYTYSSEEEDTTHHRATHRLHLGIRVLQGLCPLVPTERCNGLCWALKQLTKLCCSRMHRNCTWPFDKESGLVRAPCPQDQSGAGMELVVRSF